MKIVTYSGTGLYQIQAIFQALGHTVELVHNTAEAREPFDRLLLLGGSDIHPRWYGEDDLYSHQPDRPRDLTEWTLIRKALTDHVPVLGICRGHQMLAVASGGSLWQDVNRQKATRTQHTYANHPLAEVKSPLIHHLPETKVNSLHHQAVKTVPYGFKVLAKSHDGLIESIWRPGALGVQWHPELMFPSNHRWIALFKWLVNGLE